MWNPLFIRGCCSVRGWVGKSAKPDRRERSSSRAIDPSTMLTEGMTISSVLASSTWQKTLASSSPGRRLIKSWDTLCLVGGGNGGDSGKRGGVPAPESRRIRMDPWIREWLAQGP